MSVFLLSDSIRTLGTLCPTQVQSLLHKRPRLNVAIDSQCGTPYSAAEHTTPDHSGALKFGTEDAFYRELRKRVDEYFKRTGRSQRDCPRMYLKTAIVLTWFAASYALLVFVATTWWLAVPLAISLALSMAAIGFNIQHDGSHGAYSKHRWINKLMALSLDMLGGSSYGWACKHNMVHHTYSNITGHDDDIDIGILGRMSPHQKRFRLSSLATHLSVAVVRIRGNQMALLRRLPRRGQRPVRRASTSRARKAGTWRPSSAARWCSSRWQSEFHCWCIRCGSCWRFTWRFRSCRESH